MSGQDKQKTAPSKTQPDANLAAETRPVPSQAEGDERTVDEDLKNKSQNKSAASKAGSGQ